MINYVVFFSIGFFLIGFMLAREKEGFLGVILSIIVAGVFLYDIHTQKIIRVFDRNVTITLNDLSKRKYENIRVVYTDKVNQPVLDIPYCVLKSSIAISDIRECDNFRDNKIKTILYFPKNMKITLDKEGK